MSVTVAGNVFVMSHFFLDFHALYVVCGANFTCTGRFLFNGLCDTDSETSI